MTTSHLIGHDTQSSQATATFSSPDIAALAGSAQRVSAYGRLRAWLGMPHAEAAAAALAFRNAVATLPSAEQERVAEAEADALRHGFSFVDFDKLKDFALRATEEPSCRLGSTTTDLGPAASMRTLSN